MAGAQAPRPKAKRRRSLFRRSLPSLGHPRQPAAALSAPPSSPTSRAPPSCSIPCTTLQRRSNQRSRRQRAPADVSAPHPFVRRPVLENCGLAGVAPSAADLCLAPPHRVACGVCGRRSPLVSASRVSASRHRSPPPSNRPPPPRHPPTSAGGAEAAKLAAATRADLRLVTAHLRRCRARAAQQRRRG